MSGLGLQLLSQGLPVLTLFSLPEHLAPWQAYCGCLEPYKPSTWGMQVAWSCPVNRDSVAKEGCGIQCYDETAELLSTICPENYVYFECECRFVLPGDTEPFTRSPTTVTIPGWEPVLDFTFCSRVCLQTSEIRRFGSNGYMCLLNTSAPANLQELCYSGCGATSIQLLNVSQDESFLPIDFQSLSSFPTFTPLVFLCPSKRSPSCEAGDYCPTIDCPMSSEALKSFELHQRTFAGGMLRVVADSSNLRLLIGERNNDESCLSIVKCQGPFVSSCMKNASNSLSVFVPEDEAAFCECRLALTCMPKYSRGMLHVVAEQRARRPANSDFRVLVIGFGGGLMSVAAQLITNATVESVDIDDDLLKQVAIPHFGYNPYNRGLEFELHDCLVALEEREKAGRDFDAILVDAFEMEGTVPAHCRSQHFLETAATLIGRRQGVIVQNIWTRHGNPKLGIQPAFEDLRRNYETVFGKFQEISFKNFPPPEEAHQEIIVSGPNRLGFHFH